MSKARRQQRQTARRSRKSEKTTRRSASKSLKQGNRSSRKDSRTNAKDLKKSAKISKKTAHKMSKIYGDMSPEEVNEINNVQPYSGAMKRELEEAGVPINDPEDTIEVASKYSVLNEDIDEPIEADDVEMAYSENDDDDVNDFEHAEKRQGSRVALKAGMAGVSAALGSYFGDLKGKQNRGEELSDRESQILRAKKDLTNSAIRNSTSFNLVDIAPLLIIGVIAFFVLKK